jgi:hypothetical protein
MMPLKRLYMLMAATLGMLFAAMAPAPTLHAAVCPPRHRAPFRVFDGLIYADKPNLASAGLEPIHLVDRGIWADEAHRSGAAPDPALVRRYLDSLPADGAPVVFDLEDLDPGSSDPAQSAAGIRWFNQVNAVFRAQARNRSYGFYGFLPARDYWRAIEGPASPRYQAWQRENDRLTPLERSLDANYPSLYTFYDDRMGWATFASAQICEARRLSSKPVYEFLWPEYHSSSSKAGQFIPPDYWRQQLELAYRLADGVVIWGGYDLAAGRRRPWDPGAPWWQETERFMAQIGNRRSPQTGASPLFRNGRTGAREAAHAAVIAGREAVVP